MASLDDILTAQKNGVIALNNIQQALISEVAAVTTSTVTASTLAIVGKGRLLRFCVIVAGSADGFIHNAGTPTGAAAANALVVTPQTVGIYEAGIVFDAGLVIEPGTGQSINITYALGV